MFVAGRRAGPPGILARPRRRPGRALARHGEPGRGLPRLPDAPRGEPGDWASRWDTAWRPARATRGGRSPASRSAAGWTLLGLHNDCRYKAFFQRLKAATGSYRVDGGGGGRPQPPAPWPRRGLAAITWPAYKACEPHVVLIGLTAMAVVAIGAPAVWLTLWRSGVLALAILAPMLAIARIARAVRRGAVETSSPDGSGRSMRRRLLTGPLLRRSHDFRRVPPQCACGDPAALRRRPGSSVLGSGDRRRSRCECYRFASGAHR